MKENYHCFWINAPLKKAYLAVTEKSELSRWWKRSSDVGDRVGSISTFRFKSGACNKIKIKSLDPNKFDWVCVDGHSVMMGILDDKMNERIFHDNAIKLSN